MQLLFGAKWRRHPRIQLRLNRNHAFYASRHEKIVCIDGEAAFAGGIDLTLGRWDSRFHPQRDARRVLPNGKSYPPIHDVQLLVEGPAARDLEAIARECWAQSTGETVDPAAPRASSLWPPDLAPDFANVNVGVARTLPRRRGGAGLRESEALLDAALKAARRTIYIEAQYLTGLLIRRKLEAALAKNPNLEIVVIANLKSDGLVEHIFMAGNRERLLRSLHRKGLTRTFRIFHPAAEAGEAQTPIHVHSKVVIVDDRLVRIGSSNLNNRSLRVDSECDLAIEASGPAERKAVEALRNRLLAGHLGCSADAVSEALQAHDGSLIRAVESLNAAGGRLRPLHAAPGGPTDSIAGSYFVDPPGPIRPLSPLRRMAVRLAARLRMRR